MVPRNDLANACADAGQVEEAIDLGHENLALCVVLYGRDHPTTEIARDNLAEVYESVGLDAEAASLRANRLHRLTRPPS